MLKIASMLFQEVQHFQPRAVVVVVVVVVGGEGRGEFNRSAQSASVGAFSVWDVEVDACLFIVCLGWSVCLLAAWLVLPFLPCLGLAWLGLAWLGLLC